eukprot:6196232-Pleurochrysis_carterae.AAC.2
MFGVRSVGGCVRHLSVLPCCVCREAGLLNEEQMKAREGNTLYHQREKIFSKLEETPRSLHFAASILMSICLPAMTAAYSSGELPQMHFIRSSAAYLLSRCSLVFAFVPPRGQSEW